MRKVSWSAFLVLSLALCLAIPVMAQTNRGVIVGSITDKSGAGVPDATVKVVNVETEQAFTATTNKEGRYVAPGLLPGRYHVEVSQKGFKTAISDIVDLPVGSTLEVSLALQVGTVAEKVTVTATGTELQTESSNLGEVISGRQITELPLKDRNFTTLAELAPGVSRSLVSVLTDSQAFNQGDGRFGQGDVPGSSNNQGSTESARFSRSGGASISVNGLRPTTNNFSLDGVDNNEPQFGTIGVFPNPDAIQEFKVDTGVSKAEVGRGGANINVDIKSGTNDLHGTLYYYGQNNALNAQNYGLGYARSKNPGNLSLLAPSQLRVNEFGYLRDARRHLVGRLQDLRSRDGQECYSQYASVRWVFQYGEYHSTGDDVTGALPFADKAECDESEPGEPELFRSTKQHREDRFFRR